MMNNWQKIIAMSPKEMALFLAEDVALLVDKGCALCVESAESCGDDMVCKYTDAEVIERWLLYAEE